MAASRGSNGDIARRSRDAASRRSSAPMARGDPNNREPAQIYRHEIGAMLLEGGENSAATATSGDGRVQVPLPLARRRCRMHRTRMHRRRLA